MAVLLPIPLGFVLKEVKQPQARLLLTLTLGLGLHYFLYDVCMARAPV